MRKISILMLCLLLIGTIQTFAQGNCQAQYYWNVIQNTTYPLGVNFTNTSTVSTGGPASVYADTRLYFGDGSSGSIWYSNFHNYSSPGTYNTMLITKTIDSNSNVVICTDTAYQQVNINYSPCAANISTVNNGAGSYTFTASAYAGTPGVSYSWSFGDGTTGTGSPITHTYASQGAYYIVLTSSSANCTSAAATAVNYIDSIINCDSLHANLITNISGLNVGFANNSTFNSSLAALNVSSVADWYFGDGAYQLNTAYGYHAYAAAGTYNVTMINHWKDSTTGQLYCSDTLVYPITLTGGNTGSICDSLFAQFTPSISGLAVTFVNTSHSNAITPNPYPFSVADWYFGDGSSQLNTVNAYHNYAVAGSYNVTMINHWQDSITGQTFCTDTFTYQVVVGGGNPVTVSCDSLFANFTPSATGLTVTFYNSSYSNAVNPYPYLYPSADWYFGDGSSQTGTTYAGHHTYASPGTYDVYMVNTWRDSITNQVYCVDSFASLINVNDLNFIRGSIYWDTMATGFTYPDSIKVWLITHDTMANSLTAVDSLVVPGYFQAYQFDNKPAGDYLVKAAFLGQAVGTTGFVPTYHLSSIYWSTATNIAHAGSITAGKDIIMQTGTITSGPGFIGGNISMGAGKGTGTGVEGMQVFLRGANNNLVASSITDDAGNFSFDNIPEGTYSVYPEAMNYTTTPYNTITVTASQAHITTIDFEQKDDLIYPKPHGTGISNITKADGLNIYPNPAETQLFIENKNNLFNKLHIVNTLGQTIQENKLNNGINKIGLTNVSSGIYYLLISGPNGSRTTKIIKE